MKKIQSIYLSAKCWWMVLLRLNKLIQVFT